MRLRFKLKTLLLLFALVAVSLSFATNGLRHSYIQATFVDSGQIPAWWPKSWKAEFESLSSATFEHAYSFETTTGLGKAEQQWFRQMLEIFESSSLLDPLKVQWSHDGFACQILTSGNVHQRFRKSQLTIREQLPRLTGSSTAPRNSVSTNGSL